MIARLGLRGSLICGMWGIIFGNVIGASASNEFVLLTARIIEGIGFLGVVIAIPSILSKTVASGARDFVMAAWSAYMPIGIMLMLLAAPLLPVIGWRNFWLANALAAGTCATLLAIYVPATPAFAHAPAGRLLVVDIGIIIRHPSCLVIAFDFFAHSYQIFSLTFALLFCSRPNTTCLLERPVC